MVLESKGKKSSRSRKFSSSFNLQGQDLKVMDYVFESSYSTLTFCTSAISDVVIPKKSHCLCFQSDLSAY